MWRKCTIYLEKGQKGFFFLFLTTDNGGLSIHKLPSGVVVQKKKERKEMSLSSHFGCYCHRHQAHCHQAMTLQAAFVHIYLTELISDRFLRQHNGLMSDKEDIQNMQCLRASIILTSSQQLDVTVQTHSDVETKSFQMFLQRKMQVVKTCQNLASSTDQTPLAMSVTKKHLCLSHGFRVLRNQTFRLTAGGVWAYSILKECLFSFYQTQDCCYRQNI